MKATLVRVTKLVIGSVDLGHGVVGVLFNDRIAARHIRVVLARKTPPRRLDGVGGRVERQFQNGEGVSRHPISLPGRTAGPQNTSFATSVTNGARPAKHLCPPKGPSPALDSRAPVKSPTRMSKKHNSRTARWLRVGVIGAGLTGIAVAYRFALSYREKVGLPHRSSVETSPAEFGLAFEQVEIPAGDQSLVGWFVPAEPEGAPKKARSSARAKSSADAATAASATAEAEPAGRRPAIVVVHGWESNRGRTFAHVRYLHAAGFHCLVFDVRGHGDSPDETLPVNVPEFAEDTAAAARWAAARPEVSAVGVLGHSMGGAGAIVAASYEPLIKAVVSASAPADLVRMTRKTFQMAGMQIPDIIATPLAWFTAAVLLIPRRHSVDDASATAAAARYRGPLLLIHGAQDHGVPVAHLELIARAAVDGRGREDDPPVETLVLPDFGHRWLYEDAGCRRKTASFFARSLGGPVAAATAGERAAACVVVRPTDPVYGFGAAAGKTPPADGAATFN